MFTVLKQINFINNSVEQRGFYLLFFLSSFSIVFEAISVGSIIPLFSSILDENFFDKFSIIKNFLVKFSYFINFEIKNNLDLIKLLTLVILIIFLLRTLISILIIFYINNFIANLKHRLYDLYFKGYITLPYSFHKNKSTYYKHNNLIQIHELGNCIEHLYFLYAELTIAFIIISVLLLIDFTSTFFLILFIPLCASIIYKFTNKKLIEWEKLNYTVYEKIIKNINDVFRSIKDLKILNKFQKFVDDFSYDTLSSVKLVRNKKTLLHLPRFILEFILVFGICSLIMIFLFQTKSFSEITTLLILFGVASLRIMPSINRVLSNLQSVKSFQPVLDVLHKDLKSFNFSVSYQNQKNLEFRDRISLKNIQFFYEKKIIFENLNLDIQRGIKICIIGDSGSGKSTLIDLITGLSNPNSGKVFIDNEELVMLNHKLWLSKIGYVPQDIYILDDTITNNIAYGIPEKNIDFDKVKLTAKKCNLSDFIKNTINGYNTFLGENGVLMSGGQKQRIGIARALYKDPEILILDESTSSLDTRTEKIIYDEINNIIEGKTLIVVTHRTNNLDNFDEIIEVKNRNAYKKL